MRTPHRYAALVALAAILAAGCGSDHDSDPTAPDPHRGPASVRWENWQGMRLPICGDDGPRTRATAATGYSRTPQGAACAAINHTVRMSIALDTDWPTVARVLLADGPGKDAWVTNRVLVSITTPIDAKDAPRISGYQITSWTPERAEITVYTQFPDHSRTANHTTVAWTSAGDWRLVLPDPASAENAVTEVAQMPADAVTLEAPSS